MCSGGPARAVALCEARSVPFRLSEDRKKLRLQAHRLLRVLSSASHRQTQTVKLREVEDLKFSSGGQGGRRQAGGLCFLHMLKGACALSC